MLPKRQANSLAIIFSTFFFFVPSGKSAIIKSIKAEKRYVLLSEGQSTGFEEDKKVCFFSSEGEELGCGTIEKANKLQSLVRVKESLIENLSTGLEAVLSKDSGTQRDSAPSKGENAPSGKSRGSKPLFASLIPYYDAALRTGIALYPVTPYTYNYPGYTDPASEDFTDSIWQPLTKTSSNLSPLNLRGEFEYKPWNLCLGAKMIHTTQKTDSYDYTSSIKDSTLDYSFNVLTVGGYLDFYGLEWSVFGLGVGAEVLMNTVTFTATLNDPTGEIDPEQLYSIQSPLMIASLRIPARLNLALFKHLGLTVGTSFVLPLLAQGTPTVSVSDSVTSKENPSEDPSLDLTTQLGHTKNTYSIEVSLSSFLSFDL